MWFQPQDAQGGDCMLLAGGGQDARDVALVGAPLTILAAATCRNQPKEPKVPNDF